MRKTGRDVCFLGVVLVICAALVSHFFFSGEIFVKGNELDILFHLNRIEGIRAGLEAGQLPVRIHAFQFNGYGSPEGVFYPDLFLYPSAFLRLLGVPLAAVYHGYWIATVLLGLFVSWYAYTEWTGSVTGGALAALLFQTMFLILLSLGMSVGAIMALGFWPLAFFALWSVLRAPEGWRRWWLLVLAVTGIVQSHLIYTLLFTVAAVVFGVCSLRSFAERERRRAVLKAVAVTFLLNAWRLVPFAYLYPRIDFLIKHPESYIWVIKSLHQMTSGWHGLLEAQLWWSAPLVLLTVYFAWQQLRGGSEYGWWLTVAGCLMLTFLVSEHFPWALAEQLPLIGKHFTKFQFSFRFLPLGLVFLAYYLGRFWGEERFGRQATGAVCVAVALVSVLTMYNMSFEMAGNRVVIKNDRLRIAELPSTEHQGDYLYRDIRFKELKNREGRMPQAEDYYTAAKVDNIRRRGNDIRLHYRADNETQLQLPLFYYPGYRAELEDGQKLPLSQTGEHIMTVQLPRGEHELHIWYGGFWFFRVADVVSLITLLVGIGAGVAHLLRYRS